VSRGALSIVLHTHMPYVEGFGTWPFGEEWLWEAIATCYLPLLDVLDDHPDRVTLSLTPVLCDQLEAPGAAERFQAFLREVRSETHRRDLAAAPDPALRRAVEHSAAVYERAAERRDLPAAFAPHVSWTSAATHAVLPLLASDAGVRLQLATGVAAHRARFGDWHGGLWLPECAYAPWLDVLLEEAGVHATCVDFTDVLGRGSEAQLTPLRSPAGPLLVPIDRATIELVWSDGGYPADGRYRDSHRFAPYYQRVWAIDGAPYDPARARDATREHAEAFVAAVQDRVSAGGLCVFAVDTELLGHFWHEGVDWLRAVLEVAPEQGLDIVPLDEALSPGVGGAASAVEIGSASQGGDAPAELAPAPVGLGVTSWGAGRDLRTWSAPAAGGLAWRQRDAELRALGATPTPGERALRELLALQSSDWAFLISQDTAGDYPRERFDDHLQAFEAALAGHLEPAALRNLAPHLDSRTLAQP
jgi:1,4-alpha-glucan branching enzyme